MTTANAPKQPATLQLAPALGKQCAARVYHQLSQNWGERQPCRVKAKYHEGSQDYCGTHLPSNVAKRDRQAAEKDKAKWADLDMVRARATAEHAALAGIANPAAVPELVRVVRDATKCSCSCFWHAELIVALAALDKKGE